MFVGGANNQEPIVVQGTLVSNAPHNNGGVMKAHANTNDTYSKRINYEEQSTGAYVAPVHLVEGAGDSGFKGKGEMQAASCKDPVFAGVFLVHLFFMLIAALAYGGTADDGQGNESNDFNGLIYLVFISGVFACGFSGLSLGWMMRNATTLVKTSLIFSVGTSFAMGMLGLMFGNMLMSIMGFISFGLGCCYAYYVWNRIGFAAANLKTALSAVRDNKGLVVTAFGFLVLALIWSLWWSIAAGGVLNDAGEATLFFTLLSYFWTHQVIQNTLVCIAAGTVGTWWFAPNEAQSFFSQGLKDSTFRATTYSFGSICFGSLLVAIVQALRQLHRHARDQGEEGAMLACVIDCILGCIEGIIEYVNKWAYVYVGLYGYSYLDAGRNVMQLFQAKGWSVIITDDLVDNVLFMVSVGIGLLTGLVSLFLGEIDGQLLAGIGYEDSGVAAFFIGFIVGLVLSSILLGVVGSAVNTVIVLFAEAPSEFAHNHPDLDLEMRTSWREAWPDLCGGL